MWGSIKGLRCGMFAFSLLVGALNNRPQDQVQVVNILDLLDLYCVTEIPPVSLSFKYVIILLFVYSVT